jgi:hypothetical protein
MERTEQEKRIRRAKIVVLAGALSSLPIIFFGMVAVGWDAVGKPNMEEELAAGIAIVWLIGLTAFAAPMFFLRSAILNKPPSRPKGIMAKALFNEPGDTDQDPKPVTGGFQKIKKNKLGAVTMIKCERCGGKTNAVDARFNEFDYDVLCETCYSDLMTEDEIEYEYNPDRFGGEDDDGK